MRITGTFLDEITFDIPHQNWGREEWDADFAAMKAMGIQRVIMIRCANGFWTTYPSEVLPRFGMRHRPPVDLMEMFLDLAEKHGLEFFAGTCHGVQKNCGAAWSDADFAAEIAFNRELIAEMQSRYGHRKAFKGWYLTHEVRANDPGVIDLFVEQGTYAKKVSGGKPTLISPYFAGVKAAAACGESDLTVLTVEEHARHWKEIFRKIAGAVDIVAFQDGHVDYHELKAYLQVTRELASRCGITCWSNVESFDRDMPWRFPPIAWEKFLWKLESAEEAGIQEGITFEFSHFMSPHSMYPSAGHLYDRYCEYYRIPARAKDFR